MPLFVYKNFFPGNDAHRAGAKQDSGDDAGDVRS